MTDWVPIAVALILILFLGIPLIPLSYLVWRHNSRAAFGEELPLRPRLRPIETASAHQLPKMRTVYVHPDAPQDPFGWAEHPQGNLRCKPSRERFTQWATITPLSCRWVSPPSQVVSSSLVLPQPQSAAPVPQSDIARLTVFIRMPQSETGRRERADGGTGLPDLELGMANVHVEGLGASPDPSRTSSRSRPWSR
ncbi:hypothetical protein L227DRAFT_191020 [Lentinus tigrinus ALCF2SS1-6]|uniref:Uncharacterized protein n=1 Tax=Lentinus tigrinus ALCF2SS1-6 TaxID=1328759 RepID=A0A5C2S3V8_9APHY|nr:hypothetical protein L227DRAFT_191020 [Lentinus tigrinus ALCF2SS1-6]